MIEFPLPGGIIAAGQPDVHDLRRLRQRGVVSVVNIREPHENGFWDQEADVVLHLGMQYRHHPLSRQQCLCADEAQRMHDLLQAVETPVLWHCASSNRVGALVALMERFVTEATPESALDRGEQAGLASLRPEIEDVLYRHGKP